MKAAAGGEGGDCFEFHIWIKWIQGSRFPQKQSCCLASEQDEVGELHSPPWVGWDF